MSFLCVIKFLANTHSPWFYYLTVLLSWRFIIASWSRKIKLWNALQRSQVLGTHRSTHFLCAQTVSVTLFWANVFGWDSKASTSRRKADERSSEKRGEENRKEEVGTLEEPAPIQTGRAEKANILLWCKNSQRCNGAHELQASQRDLQ